MLVVGITYGGAGGVVTAVAVAAIVIAVVLVVVDDDDDVLVLVLVLRIYLMFGRHFPATKTTNKRHASCA